MATALATSIALAGCATSDDMDGEELTDEAAMLNNEQTAFNFFVSKGLTKIQSAGIIGNLMQESSVSPTAVEFGGGPGRGIAQWSVGGRWDTSKNDNVTLFASQHKESKTALNTQLNFIWYELNTFGYGFAQLKEDTTISAAVSTFQSKYEICGTCDSSRRLSFAEDAFNKYGGGKTGPAAECFSSTLNKEVPDNACVQSKSDKQWYQCSDGSWVDRFTDPEACSSVHPL